MNYVYEMPAGMLQKTDKKGTVERFLYNTRTYDERASLPLAKSAWVYLPYGYDAAKQYNVLYLLHGGGVNEDWWLKLFPDTVTILDNMIAQGICEPCIIVTPTYYRGTEVDRNAEFITEHFRYELRNDLIPAIEAKYSTYATGNVSEENLINTRNHRAFAGLSLGSMTTYRAAFYNNYDLFSWYGPFSGCCGPKGDRSVEVKRIIETLQNGVKNHLPLDYMFCCNGDQDIAYEEHLEIMESTLKTCDLLVPGENYDFFTIPGGVHDMKAWQLHLYHALQIFFKK
jgi:endo-1,4-beta-xylanase